MTDKERKISVPLAPVSGSDGNQVEISLPIETPVTVSKVPTENVCNILFDLAKTDSRSLGNPTATKLVAENFAQLIQDKDRIEQELQHERVSRIESEKKVAVLETKNKAKRMIDLVVVLLLILGPILISIGISNDAEIPDTTDVGLTAIGGLCIIVGLMVQLSNWWSR